jgi:hypothetical protein
MTNVIDSPHFGGPFDKLWEVQRWVEKHDYGPEDWEWTDNTTVIGPSKEEAKRRIDEGELAVPCGERDFSEDSTDVYAHYDEERNCFEADVVATCEQCGFKHTDQAIVYPTPK